MATATGVSPEALNGIDYGLARRAAVAGAGQGSVSLGFMNVSQNTEVPTAEMAISGRIGLGHGLSAEFSAGQHPGAGPVYPGAALQWQFLGDEHSPVAMSFYTQFQRESFTEFDSEGHVDLGWAGTYRSGNAEYSVNVSGGSDLDGDPRYFEGRGVAGYYLFRGLLTGVEGRTQHAYLADSAGNKHSQFLGALAQYSFGTVVVTGNFGASVDAVGDLATKWGTIGILKVSLRL
ncbi:MAG: hypothetical protein HY074_02850 [Deltaproteobacteria bacterium]|nr:hypothetical protein [Deltaproteobacteria bacterium]